MDTVTVFRGLLVASLVFALAGSFIDVAFASLLPPVLQGAWEVHSNEESGMALGFLAVSALGLLAALAVVMVGLFRLRAWSRPGAVVLTLVTVPYTVILGPTLLSGWAMALQETSSLLWGAALAMSFMPPLRERFGDPPPG
ncbi:MAG: hypothetical protein IPL06_06155 [Betaproteobacteria bacterium]|nr:hypothetical protein [Betaproteobacteria bacterium]